MSTSAWSWSSPSKSWRRLITTTSWLLASSTAPPTPQTHRRHQAQLLEDAAATAIAAIHTAGHIQGIFQITVTTVTDVEGHWLPCLLVPQYPPPPPLPGFHAVQLALTFVVPTIQVVQLLCNLSQL